MYQLWQGRVWLSWEEEALCPPQGNCPVVSPPQGPQGPPPACVCTLSVVSACLGTLHAWAASYCLLSHVLFF